MTKAERNDLIRHLERIAKELTTKPTEINADYDARLKDPGDHSVTDSITRWPRQCGALESLAETSGIRLAALVDTYLKPKRRTT